MKLKQFSNYIVEEGKKLPKPVWIAAVLIPGGFEILGVYFIFKILMKGKK
jgi:hypothetical protein